jgi:hypothetical protein
MAGQGLHDLDRGIALCQVRNVTVTLSVNIGKALLGLILDPGGLEIGL